MKYKRLIALPILGLVLGNLAYAGQVPSINPIAGFSVPNSTDFSFNNRNLNVSVASVNGGYQLNVSGTGGFTFYGVTPATSYKGTTTGTGYKLTANFDANSDFISEGSLLTITGSIANPPAGSAGTASGTLYSANLNYFGFDPDQAAIAFETEFNESWSNQTYFTGGSTGEVLYLFDQVGLHNGGHGRLSALISALSTNDLSSVAGKTYSGVESIATVPLPLPVVLFGTGIAALMGIGRKRRNTTESV